MRHLLFSGEARQRYPVALLVKPSALLTGEMLKHYVEPLAAQGIPAAEQIGFTLDLPDKGKLTERFAKDYLSRLLPALDGLGVTHLYCTDGTYFKVLTKQRKAEPHLGYVLPCAVAGFEHMQVVLGISHQSLFYQPLLQDKLDQSLAALASHVQGTYQEPGQNIIHHAEYPQSLPEIRAALQKLHQYPALTTDIEGFSLDFWNCGIGSITFAWNQHEGLAFAVDYVEEVNQTTPELHGKQGFNREVRALLKEFLETYQGNLTWHKANFDIKVLIYQLWMADLSDTAGLLRGLEVLTRNFDDTRIIAYLALNSCAGNELSLKQLAHEFAGNWAQDEIKDIRRIPLPVLLQYNLVDGLSTWYAKNKHWPTMVRDNQLDLYQGLMKDSLRYIIQMELTGMPMDAGQVQVIKAQLQAKADACREKLQTSKVIQALNLLIQQQAMEKANAKLKTKQHPLSHFANEVFNPGSPLQLQRLLYEQMGLPVLDVTSTKQPATGVGTLEKLLHHAQVPEYKEIIQTLIELSKVAKILSAFIPAFEQAIEKGDGCVYLFGWFNLGGTVSGRLSSSDPNLQNLPANSEYGKLIKTAFKAPRGWLFVGADFASLEDRINALLTKDKNKLRVYTDGFDGHALRAFAYFRELMPDIRDTVESINSVAVKSSPYYYLRQDSKAPTFALTYQGTYITLMRNLGWSEEKAKQVEANYHRLYEDSDRWVQAKIDEASRQGYAEAAFGLRIRTPLLEQTLRGRAKCPHEADAEARTLGNAISGQSYGLLTNRAANAFMAKVWASPYRLDVLPVALIHDAIYLLIREDLQVIEWVNRELIIEMRWQELPEIQHDQVKLGAELDLYWPDWAHPLTLPNDIDATDILQRCKAHFAKLREEGVVA